MKGELHLNDKRHGHYLGTEIAEKWWHRSSCEGLLARGTGEFWIYDSAVLFRRYLTKIPTVISFDDVVDVKVGRWHSGRWAGGSPVVKVVWENAGNRLSSGFVFSSDVQKTDLLVEDIRSHMRHRPPGP
ncbi:PH-like domain-containing protein [Desulfobulbus alkaliphilus]|uniref:PH-like domain-containing protein n=1 Tax=Desulfobulbus alkaliphilus TaxID=869814 RepID=UPI001963ED4A|nr:hypothetical protein [Desulfobulbus alkaliphilus]MBM9536523.1 hypothetical protein [Desulfobulbus alkaliphilus]